MSTNETAGVPAPGPASAEQELTKEIDETRQQLGDVVEQLAAKTDVKGRVTAQLGQLKDSLPDEAAQSRMALAAAAVFAVIACILLLRWRADRR
jgi:ABC-type transporter Mla subunit MlaD